MGDVNAAIFEWLYDNVTGSQVVQDLLKFDNKQVGLVQSIWDYFVIVGIGMTLIYFIMEINRKFALEGGDLNFKSMFAPFLKFIIAIIILSQASKIVGWILSFGNVMIDQISDLMTGDATQEAKRAAAQSSAKDSCMAMFKSLGFFENIGILLPMLVCGVVSLVLNVVWLYKAYLYKLEVLFRLAITPIACADIYSGSNSAAIRYLKNFLALAIYAVSFVVLPKLVLIMAATDIQTPDGVWDVITTVVTGFLIGPFAALTCTSAVKTAAKEALGC